MLPVLPVILPLFTAALLAALTKIISQRFSSLIAMAAVTAALVVNVTLIARSQTQPIVYWFGNWHPRHGLALGISFVVDPLGAGFAAFCCFLTLASLVFSAFYFDTVANHFHALLLAFLAAMCGFCLTGDIFNMFVFFELMSASAFALCAHKSDDPGSLQGALNFAVTNTIAAYFVLSGIALLYARTGALNMAQMSTALAAHPLDSLVIIAFVFTICGYLVKAAVVPFHFWLADAHAVAPSPVCVLFSGVMVEMGLFALARLYWSIFQPAFQVHQHALTNLFLSLGVITAATGSFMCYIQRNLKRLLAFSTISHVGLMLVGLALLTPMGLAGTGIYVLGHGMVKGALFMIAGILLHRFKTVDEFELRARARRERWPATVWGIAAIALAGLPFSGLSLGDDLIHTSAASLGHRWTLWLTVSVGAITSAAVLRAGGRVFLGWGPAENNQSGPKQDEEQETHGGHHHAPLTMTVPATLLAAGGILVGLLPHLQTAAARAATIFENSAACAALVMYAKPFPPLPVPAPIEREIWPGLLAILCAFAIAAADLFSPRARVVYAAASKSLRFLHRLHSGHVGDYVTFLTFGMAVIGLLCASLFS